MAEAQEPPPRYRLRAYPDPSDPAPPASPPPPSPPTRGGLVEAVARWLMGIETWKRASIALTLGTAVFLGYLVVTYGDRIFDAIDALTRAPTLHAAALRSPYDLERLARELLGTLQPDALGI